MKLWKGFVSAALIIVLAVALSVSFPAAFAESEQNAVPSKGYPVYLHSELCPVETVRRFEFGENYSLPTSERMQTEGYAFVSWSVYPPDSGADFIISESEDYGDFLRYSCVHDIAVCGENNLYAVWKKLDISAENEQMTADAPAGKSAEEVSLTFKLSGVECKKETQKTVKKGGRLFLNLSPKKGFQMSYLCIIIGEDIYPIDVNTGVFEVHVDDKDFSYNPGTGNLLIPEKFTYDDIVIEAAAAQLISTTSMVHTDLPEDGSVIFSNNATHVDERGNYETVIEVVNGGEIRNLQVVLGNGNLPFEINTKTGEVTGTGPVRTTENIHYDVDTGSLTLSGIVSDVNISATSRKDYYNVLVKATSGGTVNCIGENSVADGSSLEFAVTPDKGNKVYDIIIDGKSRGADTKFALRDMDSDHEVVVLFEGSQHAPLSLTFWWEMLIASAAVSVLADALRKKYTKY